jgi:dTDP-4-dehydrorhamnose reductase
VGDDVVRTVLVTGGEGLLGRSVREVFDGRGATVLSFGHSGLDITDAETVMRTVEHFRPDVIVHCAAMTNVDACEERPGDAHAVNALGSENMALAAERVGAKIVAISTDYVFDGTSGAPYAEDAPTNPIQVYGRSKLDGEIAVREATGRHFVVRSAWIYGPGGKNMLSRLPEFAANVDEIKAVIDQIGSPTYAPDLAEAIATLAETELFGTYHVVNDGTCTFAEFCESAVELMGADLRVEHVLVDDLGRPAPRPKDTRLEPRAWLAAGFESLRHWRDAAAAFLGSGVAAG